MRVKFSNSVIKVYNNTPILKFFTQFVEIDQVVDVGLARLRTEWV